MKNCRAIPSCKERQNRSREMSQKSKRCCKDCRHYERVNGRIVDARCRMTNISFTKYRQEAAPMDPQSFYCAFFECTSGNRDAVHMSPIPPVSIGQKRYCVWYEAGEGEAIEEYEVCGLKLWDGKWYAISESGEEFECGTRDCLESLEQAERCLRELKEQADVDIQKL